MDFLKAECEDLTHILATSKEFLETIEGPEDVDGETWTRDKD